MCFFRTMKYYLYITDACQECEEAFSYVKENQLNIEVVNRDRKDRPHQAFVFPALFCDDRLISYGFEALVKHFSKQLSTQS